METLVRVPILETERLILRGHYVEDYPDSAALWADLEVVRHITGRPLTREESWSRLLRYFGHWAMLGYGFWVIVEKSTGRFAGEVGFFDYHRDIQPSLDGMPEVGWILASHCHGRGFATEALKRIQEWGDANLDVARTACIISPNNAPSIRVAEKCGFREFTRTTYMNEPTVMFVRDAR